MLVIAKTEELHTDMKFIGHLANVSFKSIGENFFKSVELGKKYLFSSEEQAWRRENHSGISVVTR